MKILLITFIDYGIKILYDHEADSTVKIELLNLLYNQANIAPAIPLYEN